jgi:hypothetical protein
MVSEQPLLLASRLSNDLFGELDLVSKDDDDDDDVTAEAVVAIPVLPKPEAPLVVSSNSNTSSRDAMEIHSRMS